VTGKLYAMTYAEITSMTMDPIEKKPLYHFFPGTSILSLGTNGCNFACEFCQNWQISQTETSRRPLDPEAAVRTALDNGSVGIAYTYNEPLIWFEYVLDTARLARAHGLKNVLVTNGFVNPDPLAELLCFVDALNIDVKSMRPDFYKQYCKGELQPVLQTAVSAKKTSHVEITNLVIPEYNDGDQELDELGSWIEGNLGRDTPVHLSAHFPRYRLPAAATPAETLEKAHDIVAKHLSYVYIGNVAAQRGNDTLCRKCGAVLIFRRGYATRMGELDGSRCKACGETNNFVV